VFAGEDKGRMTLFNVFFSSLLLVSAEKDEEVQERDDLRKDRAKDRQRERNLARAAPDKRFEISCSINMYNLSCSYTIRNFCISSLFIYFKLFIHS